MKGTLVERQIRRTNRNILIANAGGIALVILAAIMSQRYIYNCIYGPFPVSRDELVEIKEKGAKREYLSVDNLKALDTGIRHVEKNYGIETSSQAYYITKVQDRFLLIKSSDKTPRDYYEGELTSIPSDVRDMIQKDFLEKNQSQFSEVFMPLMFDATSYRAGLYWLLGLGIAGLWWTLYNLKKVLPRIEDIKAHPAYQALCGYKMSPEEVASLIDAEAASKSVITVGQCHLTESWIFQKRLFAFTIFHVNEIVWAYAKVTQHSVNLIPTGKSHAFLIYSNTGQAITVELGRGASEKNKVEEFLQLLAARFPWVVFGYTDNLKTLYTKNFPDFVAAVATRRSEYFGESAATSAD